MADARVATISGRTHGVSAYVREHWYYLSTKGAYPGLDLLRALAVLGVLLRHFGYLLIGWIGVDLFFVISGFLIGGIVIDQQQAGRFRFWPFYRNRFLRILPTYYAFVLFRSALAIGFRDVDWTTVAPTIVASLLFLQTTGPYFFGWSIVDYCVPIGSWTLVIEQYFYILLPLFIAAFYVAGRRGARWLSLVTGMLFLSGFAARWLATRSFMPDDPNWHFASFVQFHSRYDELLAGVLAAIVVRHVVLTRQTQQLLFVAGTLPILAAMAYLSGAGFLWNPNLMTQATRWFPTLLGGGFALWVLALYDVDLHSRAVVILARLSYPIYLGHAFLTELISLLEKRQLISFSRFDQPLIHLGTLLGATLLLSYLVSLLIEYPFMRQYKRPAFPQIRR